MNGDVVFPNNPNQQNNTAQSTGPVPATGAPPQGAGTEIPLNQLPHDIKTEGSVVKPQPMQGVPPPPPPPQGGFSKGMIIKVVAGIIGLLVVIFLVFSVILPLFSRGGESKKENVELLYWGLWESESTMNVLIKDFEKDNPTIKIKYVKQDPANYREKVQAQVGTENGPDIFRFHNSWVPMMKNQLAVLPVDVIDPKKFEETYYPVISEDIKWGGAIYGIPLGVDTLALFINREITRDFDVPRDWKDFDDVATAVTVKDEEGVIKTAGAALGTMSNVTHAPDILSMMMIQSGADLYGDELASDKSKAAMGSAIDYYADFAKGDGKMWDSSMRPSIEAFAGGELAMYFGYSWDIFQIRSLNSELQFEVHPVPSLGPGRNMTVASYWVEGVSSKSQHQEAAFAFMKYLSQKTTLQEFYTATAKTREFGELYPMMSLRNSLQSNKLLYPFLELADDARATYFVSETHDGDGLNTQMNNYLSDAVTTVTTKNTSVATVVDTLVQGIESVRKQYDF